MCYRHTMFQGGTLSIDGIGLQGIGVVWVVEGWMFFVFEGGGGGGVRRGGGGV